MLVAGSDLYAEVSDSEVIAGLWRVARLADRWELLWTGEDNW